MTTREEAQKLYEDKYFYEIVKVKGFIGGPSVLLFGPYDNIYYVNESPRVTLDGTVYDPKIKFAQIVNGKVAQTFTEEEILITDRKL